METILIVNMNEQSFFRYNKKNETDTGYNQLLLELLTPPDKKTTISHWCKTDKIVFSPKHIESYVEKFYNELYLQ